MAKSGNAIAPDPVFTNALRQFVRIAHDAVSTKKVAIKREGGRAYVEAAPPSVKKEPKK
jgi:hypothetical protein